MANKQNKPPKAKQAAESKTGLQKPVETKKSGALTPGTAAYGGIKRYLPGILLLLTGAVIAIFVYRDYGMSWDEPIQRLVGTTSYDYVFNGDQTLKTIEFRDLGAGFELPLVFVEKLFNLTDYRDIYQMRHLVSNLFFLLSAFCGYLLALRLFKEQFIACLGFILLAFHPRIYAHSFLNTKDIPFLSVFIIAFLLCEVAFEKNKPVWYLLLGFACGYATSIRAMGVLLIPCISGFFLIDLLRAKYLKEKTLPVARNFLLFIAGFCALLYVAWPILWSNPVHYFIEEFKRLSHINWDARVLLAGKTFKSDMLPWYYTPLWFSITIPELWLLSGLAGFVWILIAFVKNPLKFLLNTHERNFLLYIACFVGPVIAVTALNSINYDDWRHLYFIYPSFVMLALFAINKIAAGKKKLIVALLCLLQIGFTSFFMVKYHPFQNVYFNNFVSHAPEFLRKNYDMEYWGGSFKQGLDHILETDKSKTIKINSNYFDPLRNNLLMLDNEGRNRIQTTGQDDADYFFYKFQRPSYGLSAV